MLVGYRRQAGRVVGDPRLRWDGESCPRWALGRLKVGTKVGRERRGFIVKRNGKFYVRVGWTDPTTGQRRELMRAAEDRKHAKQLCRELCSELAAPTEERAIVLTRRMTFAKLAERYEEEKLIEAKYVDGRKVVGLRRLRDPKRILTTLTKRFGNAQIGSITYNAVDKYRLDRLDDDLSIATVNRELALLRSVFNFAKREGVIERTPFECGDPLIRLSDEVRRDRVLSREEETKLLAQCVGPREHVRPIIIAAVDTGCRRGELFTLKWSGVDLDRGVITLEARNTKTIRSRSIQITGRLVEELTALRDRSKPASEDLVFPFIEVGRSFRKACKLAGIMGLRFHDLRHTCATRLIAAGMPIEEVAKILGHTQVNTTFRHYLNVTGETLDRARAALDAFNAASKKGREASQITEHHVHSPAPDVE
jgi:integrase